MLLSMIYGLCMRMITLKFYYLKTEEPENVTMMQIQVQICQIVRTATISLKGVKLLAIRSFQQYIFPPTKVRKFLIRISKYNYDSPSS